MKKKLNKKLGRTAPLNGLTLLLLMGCSGGSALRTPETSPAGNNPQPADTSSQTIAQNEAISSADFSYDIAGNLDNDATNLAGQITFEKIDDNADDSGSFTVSPEGLLQFDTAAPFTLDHEDDDANEFALSVLATDEAGAEEIISIILRLVDINDEAPQFDDQTASFDAGETAWSFTAATPDVDGHQVVYQFQTGLTESQQALHDLFDFDPTTQTLTLKSGAKLPEGALHTIYLRASVTEDGSTQETDAAITVDVSDYELSFDGTPAETISIDEKTSFAAVTFSATSADGQSVRYTLEGPDASAFVIDAATGVLTAASDTVFDLNKLHYQLTIVASTDLIEARHDVRVNVNDVAGGPTFTSALSGTIDEADNISWLSLDSPLFLTATAADNSAVTFKIADEYEGPMEVSTLNLSGTPVLAMKLIYPGISYPGFDYDTDGNTHIVPLIARDANGNETRADFTITIAQVSEFVTVPTGQGASPPIEGTSDGDTLTGTSLAELIQGGDGDDIITGNGGNDVYIGGRGNDMITLGADTDEIVYRFNSDDNGAWQGFDGADVIHNFERGVDKLLFVDTNPNGISSLDNFITAAQDSENMGIEFVLDGDDNYTGISFTFDEDNAANERLTINFKDPISDTLLDDLNISGRVLAKDDYQHINRILNDSALSDNFDVTTDITPSEVDII